MDENKKNTEIDLTLDEDSLSENESNDELDEINFFPGREINGESGVQVKECDTGTDEIQRLTNSFVKINNKRVNLFSCGPPNRDLNSNVRSINCHVCKYNSFILSEFRMHIESQLHEMNISNIRNEDDIQNMYTLYDNSKRKICIMFCIFPGENILTVNKIYKYRLVEFSRSSNKLNRLYIKKCKSEWINELNKSRPILGIEYCVKFANDKKFYCVLCTELIESEPINHWTGKTHKNNFIGRHFLQIKNLLHIMLPTQTGDNSNEIIEKIILEIYSDLERKYKYQSINVIERQMFECFAKQFVKAVCNEVHYCDKNVKNAELKFIVERFLLHNKIQIFPCENKNNDLVVIDDDQEVLSNSIYKSKNDQDEIEESNNLGCIKQGSNTWKSGFLDLLKNNSFIKETEDIFKNIEINSSLEIIEDLTQTKENSANWEKSTYSMEYIARLKYVEKKTEFSKVKCTLCNKYLTSFISSHTKSISHRILYIDKHFPCLKLVLTNILKRIKIQEDKYDKIISQIVAEICFILKKRTGKIFNQMFRINIKKFSQSKALDKFVLKKCSNCKHYDDNFFVTVYQRNDERLAFLIDLVKNFVGCYPEFIGLKRKSNDAFEDREENDLKRHKKMNAQRVPITLISVLKQMKACDDLKHISTETNRLLTHAEEMEKVNGNITELMKSNEYLNFLVKVTQILKEVFEQSVDTASEDCLSAINKILDDTTLLIESMEEAIESNESSPQPDIVTIDDDDELEFIDSTDSNTLKKLPNPFSNKFKKPQSVANKTSLTNPFRNRNESSSRNQSNISAANNENPNISSFMNITRPPNPTIMSLNHNVTRFNSSPVLNVTTYRETCQMNMSLPIMSSGITNRNIYRNTFQQQHQQRQFQHNMQSLHQQQMSFPKGFTSFTHATSIQRSTLQAPPPPPLTPQSVGPRLLTPRAIPLVLPNVQQQTAAAVAAQNSFFSTRLNFRSQIASAAPPPPPLHLSMSNNNQIHNLNNIQSNTISINQRFHSIRTPFTLNNNFRGGYNNRSLRW